MLGAPCCFVAVSLLWRLLRPPLCHLLLLGLSSFGGVCAFLAFTSLEASSFCGNLCGFHGLLAFTFLLARSTLI